MSDMKTLSKNQLSELLKERLSISRHNLNRFCRSKHIKSLLEEFTSYLDPKSRLSTRAWHIINNCNTIPLCLNCKRYHPKFNANKWGYLDFCSVKCQANYPAIKEKIKKTIQTKYDDQSISNSFQAEEVKSKIQKTVRRKYGVDHITQSKEFKKKVRDSMNEKYGVDHYSQTEEFKEKYKKRMNEKYGVDHYSQTEEFKEKFKEVIELRYGVDHPMRDPLICSAQQKKLRSSKRYKTPSGKIIYLMGYEIRAYEELLNKFHEEDILHRSKDISDLVGPFFYEWNGKRRYFPDFYIPKIKTVIEVKSTWTFNRNFQDDELELVNLLKMKSVTEKGIEFRFMIY